jgi:hypothetical protein
MATAIAYVRDSAPDRPCEVVARACQIERIQRYATDHNVEIAAWFEDEACNEDLLKRPGIEALLAYDKPYDRVLCERIRVLSRSAKCLEPFFRELDRRGAGFEPVTSMWDCVSQKSRRRFQSLPTLPRAAFADEVEGLFRHRVAKPVRLNFVHLVHHAPRSAPQSPDSRPKA